MISRTKRSRLKRSACWRMRSASHVVVDGAPQPVGERVFAGLARARRSRRRSRFRARRRGPSATTGRPHACASSGTMPKSSSPGRMVATDDRYRSRISSFVRQPRNRTSSPAERLEPRRARGRRRRSSAAGRRAAPPRSPDRRACRAPAPTPPEAPAGGCGRVAPARACRTSFRRADTRWLDRRL